MDRYLKRTWAEIDLNALENNYKSIKNLLDHNTKIMCVVKADAYGHGVEFLAKEYERLGADWFAVSNLDEAIQLRTVGIKKPILILGFTPVDMVKELIEFGITQTVFSSDYAENLNKSANNIGKKVNVHIKLDTGMGRIGFVFQSETRDIAEIDRIESVCKLKNINVGGIFTHFSISDENPQGKSYTENQFESFMKAIDILKNRGIEFGLKHCCNSGGIIDYPMMHLDMVRAGIILYGLQPSQRLKNKVSLIPVMQLKSVISQIKMVCPDSSISYGRTFISKSEMKIATIPIGYADGYLRALSGAASMLIHGRRVPVVGRVCMDQLMLDITDANDVKENDVVTVFGKSSGNMLPIDELADIAGTVNYEFVCLIGKRVPRMYLKDGENVGRVSYILPD